MTDENTNASLSTLLDPATLGPKILEAAIERRRKQIAHVVVGQAEELLRRKAVSERQIEEANKTIEECNVLLEKLDKGQFNLSGSGIIEFK